MCESYFYLIELLMHAQYLSLLCSQLEDRVFIPNSKCRTLVAKYAKTGWDNTTLLTFCDTDTEELEQLVSVYSPSISSLLTLWENVVPCPSK